MPLTTLSVNLDPTEQLTVSTKKKVQWLIPFTPIGRFEMKKPDSIDALSEICKFNTAELALLELIRNRINSSYTIEIKRKDFTPQEHRKLATAIRSYISKGLLKRTQREHYMVNPYFMVPPLDLQATLVNNWHNC